MRDAFLSTLLSILFGLLRVMPPRLVSTFGTSLSMLLYRLARKDVKRICLNVSKIYGLPQHSSFSRSFARQVISHQVNSALEVFKESVSPNTLSMRGMEEFARCYKEQLAKGHGVIVITGHMGSWELVGQACALVGGDFHALAKPSKLSQLTKALDDMRKRFGIKVIWTGRSMLFKQMLGALRSGGSLGFVMDQKPQGGVGPTVEFMGRPTTFVGGPAVVAVKTGAPVVGVFCMREGPWRYRIFAKPISVEDSDSENALTQKMAALIEDVVRTYPEQWAWNYRRWKFPAEP